MVAATIAAMPQPLRNDPAWIYWSARALATESSTNLSAHSSVNSSTTSSTIRPPNPSRRRRYTPASPTRTASMASWRWKKWARRSRYRHARRRRRADELAADGGQSGLRRAFKFFDLGLRFEGNREWNWQLRKMSERQLLAAAEFARRTMCSTAWSTPRTARAPSSTSRSAFRPRTMTSCIRPPRPRPRQDLGLWPDPPGVALHHATPLRVGASGLMQLMPATAQYVARKIGMTDFGQAR